MKLIVITPSNDIADEPFLVTKMFESGLPTLHLRKPKHSTNSLRKYIEAIPVHFHNRIMLHTHHDLAIQFKLKGIHLGRVHLSKRWKYFLVRLRLKMRFGTIAKSRSYSRLNQVYEKEEQTFDYFLIGTMFNNMTGELYSGFYEAGLTSANKTTEKILVAKGGTSLKTIQPSVNLGFKGIAFNSYIWNSDSPFENFLKILEEFKTHKLEIE